MSAIFFATATLSTLFFLLAIPDVRIEYQRSALKRFQKLLRLLFLSEPRDIIEESAYVRWKLMPTSFLIINSFAVGLYVFDDRWEAGGVVAMTNIVLGYGLFKWSPGKNVFVARVLSVVQLFAIYSFRAVVDEAYVRNALVLQCLCSVAYFESLDASLLHAIIQNWLVGEMFAWNGPIVHLPLKMFAIVILPTELMGLRAWISSRDIIFIQTWSLKTELIVALSVPVITLIFAFSKGSTTISHRSHSLFYKGLGVLHFIFIMFSVMFSDIIDRIFMPTIYSLKEAATKPKGNDLRLLDSIVALTMFVSLIFASTLSSVITGIIALSLRILLSMPQFETKSSDWHDNRWRAGVVFVHLLVMLVTLAKLRAEEVFEENSQNLFQSASSLVALATIRVLFAFEMRPFSHIHVENSFFGGLSIFCIVNDWLNSSLTLLSITACVVSLVVSLSQENSARIMKREADSQAFLSHALKQKFGGIACAIDGVFDHMNEVQDFQMNSSLLTALRPVLQEARDGHYACHVTNVIQNLSRGNYQSIKTTNCLNGMLNEWVKDGSFGDISSVRLDSDDYGKSLVCLDWELLRLLLSGWVVGASMVTVTSTVQNALVGRPDCMIEFRFRIVSPPDTILSKLVSNFAVFEKLGNYLGGKFINHSLFQVSVRSEAPNTTMTRTLIKILSRESLSSVFDSGEHVPFPSGLSFAILDDNLLVRRNLVHVVRRDLNAHVEVLVVGEDFQNSQGFPNSIIDAHIDIAIFDQNLEYEEGGLLGSELARESRTNGFSGCQILHSAQESLRFSLRGSTFDGFIDKGASRPVLVEGIKRAWFTHLSKCGHPSEIEA